MTQTTNAKEPQRTYKRRKPCGNCPFRKEAPLAYWHPTMYEMLERMERAEGDPAHSSLFACHKDRGIPKPELCVGWLLDQRRKHVPSLALRLNLIRSEEATDQFMEAEPDGEMHASVSELVLANREADMLLFPERYSDQEDGT